MLRDPLVARAQLVHARRAQRASVFSGAKKSV
jgi:hypothetical protein